MATKQKKTKVEIGEYKDSPVFKIFQVRDDGANSDYPLLSFGQAKAQAIVEHFEEIKKFAEGKK